MTLPSPGQEVAPAAAPERSQNGRVHGEPWPTRAPLALRPLVGLPMFAALGFREYRLVWGAQFGNSMGIAMDQVARGWLMYDLTGSTVELGLVAGVRMLPGLLLSPIAGVMADRSNRKVQLIVAQVLNAILNFVLAALILDHRVATWHVYVTGLAVAIVQVFEIPARQSMIAETVDRARLTNAIGLNSVAWNVSMSLGPAAAGALIATVGPGWSYVVQGVIYAFSTVWTIQLRVGARVEGARSPTGSILAGMIDGWRYIARHPVIRGGMTMVMLVALFGLSFATLLPAVARDELRVGASGQGLLATALGLGALASAFVVAGQGDRFPKGPVMLIGGALLAVAETAFGLSADFGLSMVLMVVIGACSVTCTVLINTVLQRHAEPEIRGRVMSMYQQSQVALTLGGILAGALAAAIGSPHTIALMGLACLAGVAVVGVGMPSVRGIRQ
ncbi:MAG TPA: MFS transporter [Chloroflexota bacterium]|nr:MFS transporter [Chloroflexota bacterium]